jgi:hypothetical protein
LDRLTPRHVTPEDWLRFERSMAEIFAAFGMNLETPGTERTRSPRLSLVEHAELLPDRTVESTLISVRRSGSLLFARYRLR